MADIRLPDAPPLYEMSWGTSLVNALSVALQKIGQPIPLETYTIATLPSAKRYARVMVYITDGTANQHVVVSDSLVWRYLDGVLV